MSCEIYIGVNLAYDGANYYHFNEIDLCRDSQVGGTGWSFNSQTLMMVLGETHLECLQFDKEYAYMGDWRRGCDGRDTKLERYTPELFREDTMRILKGSELKKICQDKELILIDDWRVKSALAYISQIPDDKVCMIYII